MKPSRLPFVVTACCGEFGAFARFPAAVCPGSIKPDGKPVVLVYKA